MERLARQGRRNLKKVMKATTKGKTFSNVPLASPQLWSSSR
jgi:hypothetical protein